MRFRVGDPVIYHKSKRSVCPGPRAVKIYPVPRGEGYTYTVPKFWTVSAVLGGGEIEVRTRQGKRHRLREDDPCLKKAGPVESLLKRKRFPVLA